MPGGVQPKLFRALDSIGTEAGGDVQHCLAILSHSVGSRIWWVPSVLRPRFCTLLFSSGLKRSPDNMSMWADVPSGPQRHHQAKWYPVTAWAPFYLSL